MELFEVLASRRREIKMSFEDLSSSSKIPVSTLKKIFTGVTANPPFETVRVICYAMGITTDDVSNALHATAEPHLSPAAMNVARHYDRLSESAQKLISAVVLFESADVAIKNQVISILVDHANERLQSTSSFSAAVNDLSDPTPESTAPAEEAE